MRQIRCIIVNNKGFEQGCKIKNKIVSGIEYIFDEYGFSYVLELDNETSVTIYENPNNTIIVEMYDDDEDDGEDDQCDMENLDEVVVNYNNIQLGTSRYSVGQEINGLTINKIEQIDDQYGTRYYDCNDVMGNLIVKVLDNDKVYAA